MLSLGFDEARGGVCADRADPEPARILRGEAGSPVRVPGVRGGALWFWGEPGQGVVVPGRSGLDMTGSMTLGAWIWVQRFGDHQTLVWKGDRTPAIDTINYRLGIRPEGKLEFSFKGPSDEWFQVVAPDPLPVGQWVHVAAGFDRGAASLDVGGRRVFSGRMNTYGAPKGAAPGSGDRMLTNGAPLTIGAGQEPAGDPGQFFCGAIDEVCVWPTALPAAAPSAAVPAGVSPLDAIRIFEKEFTADAIRAAPYLVGRVGVGPEPWVLSVGFPDSPRPDVRIPGRSAPDGTFRHLLDDYCGPIDLRGADRVRVSAFRSGDTPPAAGSEVRLEAAAETTRIAVSPDRSLQRIRGFGCYADLPKTFLSDPAAREREYAPLLDALRDIGVSQLDFSVQAQHVEPRNDDADPHHIDWAFFRKQFATEPGLRTLSDYLRYVQSRGFAVGLRVIGYAGWQWAGQGAGRAPVSDEVAEMSVAILTLLREEGVALSHFVPVWEPAYPPDAVAEVCAKTARLAKQQGIDVPVVGPYRIATGGQGMDMDAMPDRYLNGKQYVEAYLREMGDAGRVIGVEDYASGWARTGPNLKRLWREVIAPHDTPDVPRELWMLEYGPLCGIGPWNFYPSRWHGVYTGYESAFRLARMIHQQLDGGVNSFYFWKAYDGVGDGDFISSLGLIKSARHDRELRPPYHTARVLWKHVPRGAQHLSCTADAGILANAFVKDGKFTVLMTNPRSRPVSADVAIAGVNPAPQAYLHSSTEDVVSQEREIVCREPRAISVLLPPRSVNALVCRDARVGAPFERTVWPDAAASCVYLSDLQWAGVSVSGKSGLLQIPIDGKDVAVRQDETPAYDWLTVGGVRYRKGLGMRSPAEVVFALDGEYAAFEALVGMDDASRKSAAKAGVVFEVLVDGQKAFRSASMLPGQPVLHVRVSCAEAKTLRLTVAGEAGAMADWCEARLLR